MTLKAGEQKGLMMGIIIAAFVIVGGLWGLGVIDFEQEAPLTYYPGQPAPPASFPGYPPVAPTVGPQYGPCVGLAATPTVTLQTYDRYNPGTAIVTKNMYRILGTNTWTNVAGTGTIQLASGTQLEMVFGIDTTDETEEPPGALMNYEMPCRETKTLSVPVANDVDDAAQITITAFDENGATGTQALVAGDIKTISITITGKYEYDFGNVNCGATSNLLVAKYNTTAIDDIDITSITRKTSPTASYAVTSATIPTGIGGTLAATSTALMGWNLPVLESNAKYEITYVVDADDTLNPTADAVKWYIYDSAHYLDNNDNFVKCGLEDEDKGDIGMTGADSLTTVITA